ncbi:unnamed protein product [Prunus armeniaca]|uniref:EF-hand domain-containing protein n=1 Tax=Prunus armeniaca TaxID=36596 RepID=A0A6J5W9G2_PRUAR|nr:unnamed protein product [Prunus armeniaca]
MDKDGRISKEELRQAIRATRGHFVMFKSRLGLRSADADCNGFIDEDELNNLVDFA